jgi:hypothetical protein
MISSRCRSISRIVISLRTVPVLIVLLVAAGTLEAGEPAFQGQVLEFQQKQIYHSPETPGYTSWVGLWLLPNGAIQCDFAQGTGPTENPVMGYPLLQSTDNGKNWTNLGENNGYSRGVAVLPDGTLVRPAETDKFGPFDIYPKGIFARTNYFFGIQRSTDGGKTWSDPINLVAPTDCQLCWPSVIKPLRDGRLVAFAGVVPKNVPSDQLMTNITKTMFISSDKGQTWSSPITLMPAATGVCEESDFVELSNGNLLWIHRAVHDGVSSRQQSISRKSRDTFVPDPPTPVSFPHSGFPCELMTHEGIILDLCSTGSHWSADQGTTWHDLMIGDHPLETLYYPQAVQTPNGTIVVVAHRGSDDVYGTVDQAVIMQSFRLSAMHVPEP